MSTNHTFRLAALSPIRLASAAQQNLEDMERILETMAEGPLRLFRIGSSFVPFASHAACDFDWHPFVASPLREIGERYVPMGFRFSMHPGQYTVLNSPVPEVVERALAELRYSVDVLDLMGLDGDHKVVIHGGGLYGDREASTERLIAALNDLSPGIRNRLVIENDERYFSLAQIVDVSEKTGIPAIFDLHHHQINPGDGDPQDLLMRLRAVWPGRPKVHLSSQKPNARVGAHDDMLHEPDLAALCAILPFEADLMVEAKAKEAAAMAAWNWLHRP